MQTALIVYGIIGVVAGLFTLLGINSLVARRNENMTVQERNAVSIVNRSGHAFWVIIVVTSVVAWPLLVAMFLTPDKEE
jgi:hypothetical protein